MDMWMILNAFLYEYGFGIKFPVLLTVSLRVEFSDDVYKHAKKADQDAIRSLGSKAQARFDTAVNQIGLRCSSQGWRSPFAKLLSPFRGK